MLKQSIRALNVVLHRKSTFSFLNSLKPQSTTKPHQTQVGLNYQCRYLFTLPKHQLMNMPALSPTMSKGNIMKWLKKEGDKLEAGDVLCEVETDKATVGFEVQEPGYLAKILKPEGTKDVNVGELVAVVVNKSGDVSSFSSFTQSSTTESPKKVETKQQETKQPEAKQPEPKQQPQKPAQSSYPKHQLMNMPALSPTMSKGNIMKWLKKEGDQLDAGDVLCEVETDKASVGFEVQEPGYLAKILKPEGTRDVNVGELVAVVVTKKTDVAAFASFTQGSAPTQDSQPQQQQQKATPPQTQAPEAVQQQTGSRVYISPLAKGFAEEKGVNFFNIKGTGIEGSITKANVEAYIAQQGTRVVETVETKVAAEAKPAAQPQPAGKATGVSTGVEPNQYQDTPLTNMRKVIAARLLESKTTIPHYYLTINVNMDQIIKVREELNKVSKVKISVNDFIVKACALALRDQPDVNSQWLGDKIRKFTNADISIAVSTDSGLITPIVFNAGAKGLSAIASTTKSLAEKARTNKLKPQEFQGGTFTVSNLGMFGIDQFIAVINPPQACILAVGRTSKVLLPDDHDETKHRVVNVMSVTLSCDHRVVDGAVGAQWMQKFKGYMESPTTLLL